MVKETVVIVNPSGLHARPASNFVGCAGKYKSRVRIRRTSEEEPGINGKSIVLLLTQGYAKGQEIELTADGEDEQECLQALVELIRSGFGEI